MLTKSKAWFSCIERHDSFFNRVDDATLVLTFSGYKCANAYQAETDIMGLGGFVLSMEYDRLCGKTFVKVREPRNVLTERAERNAAFENRD